MNTVVNLPDNVVRNIGVGADELEQKVIESLAIEGYRSGKLSKFQISEMLGFDTPMEADEFLKAHRVFDDYSEEELDRQRDILENLLRA
jgi:predicted HTH domain antitoxin